MQVLVYVLIFVAGLALGAAGHFVLALSWGEAAMLALVCVGLFLLIVERTVRRRSEARFERAIEELSRLLATDAQAGAVLNQRVNALLEIEANRRLDALEADVSVLGTVVRQVAETIADVEAKRSSRSSASGKSAARESRGASGLMLPASPVSPAGLPPDIVDEALDEGRFVLHWQPIFTLPQRRVHGHNLVPRLQLEGGRLVDLRPYPNDAAHPVGARIGLLLIEQALVASRAQGSRSVPIYLPLPSGCLGDPAFGQKLMLMLDGEAERAENFALVVAEAQWLNLADSERRLLREFVARGGTISIDAAQTLRHDYAALASGGVRTLRVDAGRFIAEPEELTDFHTADVTSYLKRYGIDLIATDVRSDDQVLSLIDDAVSLAEGTHLAAAGPRRSDGATIPARRAASA